MLDIEAYFKRIGYKGIPAADLSTLRALHALHPAAIVFENLDPLLGRPVPLDLPALQAKLVADRRGGYCFEQNTLFKAVLEKLGFTVSTLAARVRWMVPAGAPPNPRAHMLLKVELDAGAFLADVGFGGLLASAPLKLTTDVEQETPSAVLRLIESDGFVTLQARLASDWQDVYRFTMEPQVDRFRGRQLVHLHASEIALPQRLDGAAVEAGRTRQSVEQTSRSTLRQRSRRREDSRQRGRARRDLEDRIRSRPARRARQCLRSLARELISVFADAGRANAAPHNTR
ncbi:MAG: arylamine N-acetyltransferase [Hyphomicrobiales bacterium]|nr:arylamine N-acetyltransferase [Hyphomicrobiales bacterium]